MNDNTTETNDERSGRETVFESLSAARFTKVEVKFDGGGYDGEIGEMTAWKGEDMVLFPDRSFYAAIAELCLSYLERDFAGWKEHLGTNGPFALDVERRTITLEFNKADIVYTRSTHTY